MLNINNQASAEWDVASMEVDLIHEPGKSLYRGKVHYSLCSCQSALSWAVGQNKIKLCFSKQLIKKLIDNCTSSSASSPCVEIFQHKHSWKLHPAISVFSRLLFSFQVDKLSNLKIAAFGKTWWVKS